jgi:hypothetical protein
LFLITFAQAWLTYSLIALLHYPDARKAARLHADHWMLQRCIGNNTLKALLRVGLRIFGLNSPS